MSLEQRCLHEVGAADRESGEKYLRQKRVRIDAADDYGLNATIRGAGRTYEVQIDWFDTEHSGILTASCGCPTYLRGLLCKHIWATLLMADKQGKARRIGGTEEIQVLLETAEASESLADDSRVPVASTLGQKPRRSWKEQFDQLRRQMVEAGPKLRGGQGEGRRLAHYRVNVLKSMNSGQLVIDLFQPTGKGTDDDLRPLHLSEEEAARFLDPADHELLAVLLATAPRDRSLATLGLEGRERLSGVVPPVLYDTLLRRLSATGRFGWISGVDEGAVEHRLLTWAGDEPWRFVLVVDRDEVVDPPRTRILGRLQRGVEDGEEEPEVRDLSDPLLVYREGIVIFRDEIAPLSPGEAWGWASLLRRDGEVEVPESEVDAMLDELWRMPILPLLDLPPQWRLDELRMEPDPGITFTSSGATDLPGFDADVWFDYDGIVVQPFDPKDPSQVDRVVDRPHGRLIFRDIEVEDDWIAGLSEDHGLEDREALKRARRAGTAKGSAAKKDAESKHRFRVPMRDFTRVARDLIDEGWIVDAEGKRLKRPVADEVALSVSSHIDWFELEGEIDFGDAQASLPALLEAVRNGEHFVRLDDGTYGLLPEQWIERYRALAESTLAHSERYEESGTVRFLPSQALMLDRLIEAQGEVEVDSDYQTMRNRLQSFDQMKPANEPKNFLGELRAYQKDGLGWLKFLEEHGFGGCLADDMGLGKTVQVLALLQARRNRRVSSWERLPSMIVVPRSLVHNWIEEAARFTPKLKILNYTGPGREEHQEYLDEYDVIVTTYGTLRRDIELIEDMELDYAILDEAQAIKNASSQAAKACRRVRAAHRLALTGTPVENHLGELWSIFEFLNPGMLSQSALRDLEAGSEQLMTVSAALKPFIFRRTKEEVLKDLPAKTELTLYCELEGDQRQFYKELRDFYRAQLNERIEQVGLKKSKIQVLEALLRLRQAACHPGLIDESNKRISSAKLDTLLEHLEEVLDEGHKALVFSQFTSLLSIVREDLDAKGVTYEYLDGRTRNRQEKVDRFQTDDDCRLFLISLKAGGVGLNLTAADYVFILDPWWNPAVEAQAIDRAHRIGQTRPVFAYRLISRGTVEEKILKLQGSKKELADAILSADKSLIGELSAKDLEVLLS
ncbi:MAG: DEAD/DEAH box helicase [Thermoanaerobaculia bacterium]|nr:DEAD/DEAH box helicase [Thermoanaerobaculia bacterium]